MSLLRYHVENVRGYLDDHWAIRLLVAPVLVLGGVVMTYALLSGNTGGDSLTLAGGYLLFSLAAVLVGLALEALGRRLTGGSLLGP
jgi:hypothetical protein